MSADRSLWTSNAVLTDGETVSIRPIEPTDAERLAEFHRSQSADSIYRRYFTPKPELSKAELKFFTEVDLVDRAALVVESHGELLGWASYERWPGRDDADTAFMVDDRHHGEGIATLLLEHLAAIATANGIVRFTAEVLGENRPMLSVFARAGFPLERRFESGVIEVDFPIADTTEYLDSIGRREQRADSRAMARFLLPRSIAVVGASDRPGSVGDVLWRNVTAAATLPVYAVNPNRRTIGDTPVFARITDAPPDISLAVIAVPAAALEATIDDCITARVRGAVIVTSIDAERVNLDALIARARSNGMRIVGPSSMGVASAQPQIGLDASLLPARLSPGVVAISMQSGSLGASFWRLADRLHLGLSWFVSLGDKSDVSANDLLQFWDDDETTRVIGVYTETLGNPRRFARISRRVSQRRPIVAVRTGPAATGALASALYQHCGLIEVPTVAALVDTARVLATQPVLAGDRIAVISNDRSPRTLAEAAIDAAGLRPVAPPQQLGFDSGPTDYAAAITSALADDGVDGVMVIHAPPLPAYVGDPVDQIDAAAAGAAKPVTAVLLAVPDGPIKPGSVVPNFLFPEAAAAVLGRSRAYGRWLRTEGVAKAAPFADVDDEEAASVIGAALAAGRSQLDPAESARLLACYGISVPASRFVAAGDASAAASEIGFPVAVKARQRRLGRSVRAGVALDLVDAADVSDSVQVMREELGNDADFVIVQAMTAPGLDLRIRCVVDESLGPLVSVGLGGIQAGLGPAEREVRLAPLSEPTATGLVAASSVGEAIASSGLDPASFVEVLIRAGQLAADHPQITSLDLNPVITTPAGCSVTDAVVSIAASTTPATALRQL